MCGIIACLSTRHEDVSSLGITGLRRLRYRGYDSFGFATLHQGSISLTRSIEPLDESITLPESSVLIGHTRWATNGAVSIKTVTQIWLKMLNLR